MRHQPKPDPSPLHSLVDAVPVEALRALVLTLLQNGAAQTAPPATPVRRRRRGWPKGKPRGRRPPIAVEGRGRKEKAAAEADAARRKRNAWRRKHYAKLQQAERAKRAAKAERAAGRAKATAVKAKAVGNGSRPAAITPARFWNHAKRLAPKDPPRAVMKEFDLDNAQVVDAYRTQILPPGLLPNAIERFLEVRATT